jgi:hypothetical protein
MRTATAKATTTKEGRARDGRFAEGNAGGPGRPRRSVERDYLAVLSSAVTLEVWWAICDKAVELARNGDRHAREWLSHYLLGAVPPKLLDLAADEARGKTSEEQIKDRGRERGNDDTMRYLM